tara:strand:- start:2619 stop:3134 length:516 start_codon:yes stop_codon:yes gene_type:complete
MLIKQTELVSIKENKLTFVKNFVSLERKYDFNLLSKLMEENIIEIFPKSVIGHLKDVFHMGKVIDCLPEFKTFFDFLSKLLKYERDERDNVDIFFSFVSQAGNPHVDVEDVFILGLKGKTIYRIFNNETKDYLIEEGDLIFIPRGVNHKVIGTTPRIIASIGFYGKRFNDN